MADDSEQGVPCYVSYENGNDCSSRDEENGETHGRKDSRTDTPSLPPIPVLLPDMSDGNERKAFEYLDNGDTDEKVATGEDVSYPGAEDDTKVVKRRSSENLTMIPGLTRLSDYRGLPHFRLTTRSDSSSSSMACEGSTGSSVSTDETTMGSFNSTAAAIDSDEDYQAEPTIMGDDWENITTDEPSPPVYVPEGYKNHYFCIQQSNLSGLGAFAVRKIRHGTVILAEKALFHGTERTLYDEFEKLGKDHQAAFLRLHAYYQSPKFDKKTAIFRTNGFATHRGLSIFLVASRFNNACPKRNNITYSYHKAKQCMVFKANCDISAGTELTIFYGGCPSILFQKWGFRCTCGACQPLTDEECAELVSSSLNW